MRFSQKNNFMFDRTFIIHDKHSREAARIVAKSYDQLSNSIRETSEREIESKNRVDITLAEYEHLKSENERLRQENEFLRGCYTKIGVPPDLPIIQDSITRYYSRDYIGFKDGIRIEFQFDCSLLDPDTRRLIEAQITGGYK